jgi:hypothetical protein
VQILGFWTLSIVLSLSKTLDQRIGAVNSVQGKEVAIYSENLSKMLNTLCWQNADIF